MTNISWTHPPGYKGESWNPIVGCSAVDEGCRNCYAAMNAATRLKKVPAYQGLATVSGGVPRWSGDLRFLAERIDQPLRWRNPRCVFVNSMSDLFHPDVWERELDRIFAVMALAPRHIFIVLTKRAEGMRRYLIDPETPGRIVDAANQLRARDPKKDHPPIVDAAFPFRNIWLGVSVSDQASADDRIPQLLATPAALRLVSYEPALGPVDFHWTWVKDLTAATKKQLRPVDWLITGGESGPRARPMMIEWARSARDQAKAAGVSFFFKQWGEWAPPPGFHPYSYFDDVPETLKIYASSGDTYLRSGRAETGSLLDGVDHKEFPI